VKYLDITTSLGHHHHREISRYNTSHNNLKILFNLQKCLSENYIPWEMLRLNYSEDFIQLRRPHQGMILIFLLDFYKKAKVSESKKLGNNFIIKNISGSKNVFAILIKSYGSHTKNITF